MIFPNESPLLPLRVTQSDGEEISGQGKVLVVCSQGALDVFASRLNTQVRDSSSELEPQLVLSLLRLLGKTEISDDPNQF